MRDTPPLGMLRDRRFAPQDDRPKARSFAMLRMTGRRRDPSLRSGWQQTEILPLRGCCAIVASLLRMTKP